jgi:hypothetical protein
VIKPVIGVLGAILALASCASSSHAPSHPKAAHTLSAVSQKSYADGEAAGKSIAIPNETDGQVQANCDVTALENMPTTDIKSRFLEGCVAGTILGMVAADQAGNG